ncbi:MAG: hypothetical protein NTU51_07830 [Bacteroidetes bacterium]|nr:hypothetical protein [Bacteroidota bacterium]
MLISKKTAIIVFITFVATGVIIFTSCHKSGVTEDGAVNPTTLIIRFENKVDTLPLILDSMMYKNSSNDFYEVTDLQYFISDITLHKNDGSAFTSTNNNGIHYIDSRLPSSLLWIINSSVPSGSFDSISFTFGINAEKNYSYRYLNPPERDMNWPEILGGGYHYMKMNLMWKKAGMNRSYPFNFHLGIGQIYKGNVVNTDSILRYVQNFFYVKLPSSGFSIGQGQVIYIVITMNLNNWFSGDNDFDFANYPNMMMQNQTAMNNACMNGRNAFTVRFTSGGE